MASVPPSPLRRIALAIAAVVALAAGAASFDRLFAAGLPAPMDFAAFWTAGKIGLDGGDVYDGAAVRDVQRGLGLDTTAIMMWNPPWALTLVLPLGWFPFKTAYAIWVLLNIGLLIASADLLWRGLGGPPRFRGLALALTLAFAPTLLLVFSGQLTAFVLFGLAGFLVLRPRHPVLAGMVGALTAIKPHMLVLFALWLIVDAIRTRGGRKVLLGGIASLLLLSAIPTALDPGIWSHYAAVTTGASSADHEHVANWSPPLIGWWLRTAVPGQPFWIQWLPLVLGVAVFGARSASKGMPQPLLALRAPKQNIPALVGFSMLIAPYGVWTHDLVLMLLPILATAVKLANKPNRAAIALGVSLFVLADVLLFAMIVAKSPYEWFVWVVPATLIGCFAVGRIAERETATAPLPAGA
jgi:hypothetical protein